MANEQYKAEYDEAYRVAVELVKRVNDEFINNYKGRLSEEQKKLIDDEEQALNRLKEAEKNYFGEN